MGRPFTEETRLLPNNSSSNNDMKDSSSSQKEELTIDLGPMKYYDTMPQLCDTASHGDQSSKNSFDLVAQLKDEGMLISEVDERPSRLHAILKGMKENLIPGIVIIILAAVVVISYYNSIVFRAYLDQIAELKSQYGYLFSSVSTCLFGGIIPFVFISIKEDICQPNHYAQTPTRILLYKALFYVLFYAEQGAQVDAFYRLQAVIFGEGTDLQTIVIKTAVDNFIYSTFISAPISGMVIPL